MHLLEDIEAGLEVKWHDITELPDAALVVCTSFAGSIAPETFDTEGMEQRLGLRRSVRRGGQHHPDVRTLRPQAQL